MIKKALARKFIEQVTQYTDYNINIMDEKGVIIASRDPERVGDFHEVAYDIVTGRDDLVVTAQEGDYPGVKPGINMAIDIDGKREGVVGITGDPGEIKPVALITKMAIEAMLKYEKQQEELMRRQNRKEQLIYFLTQEPCADAGMLRELAGQLQYSESRIRVPILCRIEETDPGAFLSLVKSGPDHNTEDISAVLDENHVLIFKTMQVRRETEIFANYKYEIGEYLSVALRWLREQEKSACFYIGSFQGSFTQYYYAYRHCKWLEETIKDPSAVFFYDYSGRYIRTVVPVQELQRMFQVYQRELGEDFRAVFLETGGALMENNYNLALAAKALFIHRNTLLYRFQKIKNTLNIDPISRSEDRFFMEALYNFFMKEH